MKRVFLACLLWLAAFAAAFAQQAQYSIPIGRWPGVTGFNALGPCTAGTAITGNGLTSNPKCSEPISLITGAAIFGPWEYVLPGCGNPPWFATGTSGTATITIATPGVVTWSTHGQAADMPIYFTTTGALPTGLTTYTAYYVLSSGLTSNTFKLATTPGGTAINTSGSQSGVHTIVSDCMLRLPTMSVSGTSSIYEITATGGGAGGAKDLGGGGAAGTVRVFLSGIPASTSLYFRTGAAGFGTRDNGSPHTATNGTDSIVYYGTTQLFIAERGHVATNVVGGHGGNVTSTVWKKG